MSDLKQITEIVIQPETEYRRRYFLGKTVNNIKDKLLTLDPVVTSMIHENKEGVNSIKIFVNDVLYVEYVNVPCAIYYI